MGAWEELMRTVIGQQAQPDFSEGDNFRDFAGLSDSLGQSIIQNRDNFGTKEAIAGALITGLLGGGFDRASKDYQAGQKRDYTKAILDSFNGRPVSRGDLQPSLFDNAMSQANVLDLYRDAEQQAAVAQYKRERAGKIADTLITTDDPEQTLENVGIYERLLNPKEAKKAEPLVKQDPYLRGEDGEAIGSAAPLVSKLEPSTNPNSRRYKYEQDQGKIVRDIEQEIRGTMKTSPIAQQYQTRLSAMQNILANVKNDTVYGDLALINGFQKIQDPEGSVREGDVDTIKAAQDRLSRTYGDVKGWFTSEGRLKPDYRRQLAATAANTVNAYGDIYGKFAEENLGVVERAKGNRANIPYVPHSPIDISKYFGDTTKPTDATGSGYTETQGVLMGELSDIKGKLEAGGLSPADKAGLVNRARQIASSFGKLG